LGVLLRHWRHVRGKSQLDLSLDTSMSQRHISFVESGRSVPSREKLVDIADALDIPLRERNTLLLAAGYAPIYPETAWDAPDMQIITGALQRMLRQHEPFPAVVLDRHWTVVMANEAAPRFFGCFIDMAARPRPRNILHLMFDPLGMRPFIANWDAAAKGLLARVHRESVGRVVDDTTRDLVAALLRYPDVKTEWTAPQQATELPIVPLSFAKDGKVLNYFSLVTTVGTPQTIAAQELRVECMFPADAASEAQHAAMMVDAAASEQPAGH
jgi:transcriptional regulator with XRE-family HTH domain